MKTDFEQWLENMNVTGETAHTLALLREAYQAAPATPKAELASRTIRFNAAIGAIVALLSIPQLSALIPVDWMPFALGIALVGNIYLRFRTDVPLDGPITRLINPPDKIG